MSNILDFGVSSRNVSKVGGTGTTIKYFPRPVGGATGGAGPWPTLSSAAPWSTLYSSSPNSSTPQSPNTNVLASSLTPAILNPNNALWIPVNSFDGVPFEVNCAGTFGSDTGDPSGTVIIRLQAVTGTLQNPVFTTIGSTSSLNPTYPAAEPFQMQFELVGDSVSGFLIGSYTAMFGNLIHTTTGTTAPVVIDTTMTGLDFQNGNPALQQGAVFGLVVGITFGTSNATNTASLTSFTVES